MSGALYVVYIPGVVAFGPFTDKEQAERYAEFVTAEIDPATVRELASPVDELLRWRVAMREWTAPK